MRLQVGSSTALAITLSLAGCFNPPPGDGETTATTTLPDTTGAPPTSSTSTSTAPTGETTADVPATTSSTCPGGCGPTTDDSSSTTTTTNTTGDVPVTATSDTGDSSSTGGPPDVPQPEFEFHHLTPVAEAHALVVADFDQDSVPDIAVSQTKLVDPSFSVIWGDNPISAQAFSAADSVAIAAHNVDGDNFPDIVLAHRTEGTIRTYSGDGMTFTGNLAADLGGCDSPSWLASAEFDGQPTLIDWAVGCSGLIDAHTIPGSGNGGFGAPLNTDLTQFASSVALVDLVGSVGPVDLIVVSQTQDRVGIYPGNDMQQFTVLGSFEYPIADAFGVAIGQVDGDLIPDFMVLSPADGTCHLFLGKAGGVTPSPAFDCGPKPGDIVLADLNGDELDDLVTLHPEQFQVAYSHGDGTFTAPITYLTIDPPIRAATGLFDNDDLPDITFTTATAVYVYRQIG